MGNNKLDLIWGWENYARFASIVFPACVIIKEKYK
jgi:hypothetical protein